MKLHVVEDEAATGTHVGPGCRGWLTMIGALSLGMSPFVLGMLWIAWLVSVMACGWSCPAGFEAGLGGCECLP